MTDSLVSTIVWCMLQISLVSVAGVVVALVLGQRNAFDAGSAIVMAIIVCGGLTLLAPFPVHHWFFVGSQAKVAVTQTRVHGSSRHNAPEELTEGDAARVPLFDWRELAAPLQMLATHADRWEKQTGAAVHGVVWLLALAAGFGCWRFATGVAYVVRIRRGSAPIQDDHLSGLLHDVAKRLACRRIPGLRESSEFLDAAVAGWLRPAVILPAGWREWSDEECRSVLAHEVAHVVGRDALWRLVTASVLAMHFYNPLMHWLFRRLVLCQELASDALAARVVGGRCYLRSLSSLALRQDDRLRSGVASSVLPVFSGDLIRRINVLSSMKDEAKTKPARRRSVVSGVMFLTFLAAGLAAVATRGIAQPPVGEQKPTPTPGAAQPVSFTKSISENKPVLDPTREMFGRPPIDPSAVGATNPQGMFVVRVQEVLNRPELQLALPAMNTAVAEALEQGLKTTSLPTVQLETIAWIGARPNVVCKKATESEEGDEHVEQKTQLMFGAGAFSVKLTQPFDLKSWIEKYAPTTTRHTIEGRDVFQWQTPALGHQPAYVWMQDETTLRMNYLTPEKITPDTKLADLLDPVPSQSEAEQSSGAEIKPISWAAAWQRIDGGLASVVLPDADLSGLFFDFENRKSFQTETLDAVEHALLALKSRCQMSACSLDLGGTPTQVGLRISLIHASHNEAMKSVEDVQELLKQSQTFLRNLESSSDESPDDVARAGTINLICEIIDFAAISLEAYDDQTAAVVISTTMPFAKLFEIMNGGEGRESP